MQTINQNFTLSIKSYWDSRSSHPGMGDSLHSPIMPVSTVESASSIQMFNDRFSAGQTYLAAMGMATKIQINAHFRSHIVKFGWMNQGYRKLSIIMFQRMQRLIGVIIVHIISADNQDSFIISMNPAGSIN